MPQVPTYDAPQEQPRALPSPDLHSVVSPDLLDAGARQAQEAGAATVRAGTSFAEGIWPAGRPGITGCFPEN